MRLLAPAALVTALCATSLGHAQSHVDERPRRLTDRGGLMVSFEHLFGVAAESIGRRTDRITHMGVGSTLGPRIGVHGVVAGGFTAGGTLNTLFLFARGRLDGGLILIGPRVGWMITGDVLGVWPRVGVDWMLGDDDLRTSFAAELPLTIRLTQHAGVMIGPSVSLPASERADDQYRSYAFTAGLFGAF